MTPRRVAEAFCTAVFCSSFRAARISRLRLCVSVDVAQREKNLNAQRLLDPGEMDDGDLQSCNLSEAAAVEPHSRRASCYSAHAHTNRRDSNSSSCGRNPSSQCVKLPDASLPPCNFFPQRSPDFRRLRPHHPTRPLLPLPPRLRPPPPLTCEESEARLYWPKAFFMADTATPA